MTKDQLEDRIRDLCSEHRRAEIAHINADRMGSKYERDKANRLEKEFEENLTKLVEEISRG